MQKEPTPTAWNKKKEKLKDRFPNLTEEDLIYPTGEKEQLIRNLQENLGKSRSEVKQIIKSL